MKVEIIAVGNEVITGNTVNTNASYLAKNIQKIGLTPCYHSAVGDDKNAIEIALLGALKRVQVVILTGGLGPTDDDFTKETVCEILKLKMQYHPEVMEKIVALFDATQRTTPENNKKQAYFPENACILSNPNGTAPGCIIPIGDQYVVLLPGPPKELIPMVETCVIPYFRKLQKGSYYTLDVKVFGIGESHLVIQIADLLGDHETLNVAPYVGKNEIIIRIKSYDENEEVAIHKAHEIKNKLEERLGEAIIGYNDSILEESIMALLEQKRYSIATVESCTGGLLSATLVNCSGISDYFSEGITTYSNEAKTKYVGVKRTTLDQFGAVSKETAKEMAEGIQKASGSYIGLSTTGIAGPTGGTKEKPVGLVYIGIALGDQTYTYELRLNGTRTDIREKTVAHILYRLYNLLRKEK
ncbi:MAG: competence/damage-inducible protein A [Cellulosilyticaceae bacterium]